MRGIAIIVALVFALPAFAGVQPFDTITGGNPGVDHSGAGTLTAAYDATGFWTLNDCPGGYDGWGIDSDVQSVDGLILTMDLKGDWSNGSMLLMDTTWTAGAGSLLFSPTLANYADWTTVTFVINEAATSEVWGDYTASAADVQWMGLYPYDDGGSPVSGLSVDNFGIIPEPVSLSLLAVAGLRLLARRKRRA